MIFHIVEVKEITTRGRRERERETNDREREREKKEERRKRREEKGNLSKCVYTVTPGWAGPGRCEMFAGAIVLKRAAPRFQRGGDGRDGNGEEVKRDREGGRRL